jgi:hypothetical protein
VISSTFCFIILVTFYLPFPSTHELYHWWFCWHSLRSASLANVLLIILYFHL